MSTHSITHRPISLATAGAAAVAAVAVGALVMFNDASPTTTSPEPQLPPSSTHGKIQLPEHGGTVQLGLP